MGSYDVYREKIIECTQWLSAHGFFGTLRGTGGNVSVRIEKDGLFAITPSSLEYEKLVPENICVLDFEMNTVEGTHPPSVEASMHLEVYKQRRDVNAVVHTHQICGSTLAAMNKPIPPLFDEVCMNIGAVVDVIPYALSGSPELVQNVASRLNNQCHCYLMQNHGTLNLGNSLEKAWLNAELLEKTARIYLTALAAGHPPTELPADIVDLIRELRKAEFEAP